MKRFGFIALLFFVTSFGIKAQSVIDGIVRDKEDAKPIEAAVVTILDGEGEILAYAISRKDGTFTIKINNPAPHFTLHTRFLGYQENKRTIENRTQYLIVELTFGEIELREVVVKSRPLWNREDTLVYSVEAFKSHGDKTIADIIKKLPGVEVSESGGIKYQGEAINKFYIEGLDLLENRYGIATHNVPVDAVQNVEVIENHEPLNALKDISASDKAAINLRLKKEKMDRPVGTVTLGGGYSEDLLWLLEAFALNASKERQYIAMYKTNNAAKSIRRELLAQSLSVDELQDISGYSEKSLLQPRAFNFPPLEKKRYLFNKSHTASVNNLWKTGQNSQIRANMQYLNDVSHETIRRKNAYFLPDRILHINESNILTQKSNILDAMLTYTVNSPGYFLNNALKWTGRWDKTISSVESNMLGVNQYFNLPSQTIKNDLKYVKRWGKRVWNITSFAVYASQPQQLAVRTDTTDTNQLQKVDLSGFYTRNSTYYSIGVGESSLILKMVAEASLNRFQSELQHPVFTDSTRSRLAADYMNLELTPAYNFRTNRLNINAEINLRRHTLVVDNRLAGSTDTQNFSFADPAVRINYKFSPMINIRMSYKYANTIGDFMDLADVYLMSAYRHVSKRSGMLTQSRRQSFSAGMRYRNPLTTFFLNSSFTYSPSTRNFINYQQFIGNESVTGNQPFTTHSGLFMWQGYAGKYFAGIRTNISLSASCNSIKNRRLQQGVVYPVRSSGWVLLPKINVKISDQSSVTYQTIFADRITEITRQKDVFRSSLRQMSQQLSGYYLIGKRWQLNAQLEYSYNEIGKKSAVKILFADMGITYKHTNLDFDFSWNNIFNQRYYSYSLYNGLDRFDYMYILRPSMLMLTASFKY